MTSIRDDRGYNQGFAPSVSATVRMKRRTEMLLSEMEIASDTRILEIGCGTGEVSYGMALTSAARVVGTDLCVPFIEEAKDTYHLPNLSYEVMDFSNSASFPDRSFDYIVGNGILHHLYHDLDEAFLSMRRLLKENGKIIFLEPNVYNPYIYLIFSYSALRKLARLEPTEMAFSKRFIEDTLSRAGFKNIQVDYRDFLLPGIPRFLIKPSIFVGAVLEKLPLFTFLSQSLFIRASVSSSSGATKNEQPVSLIRYGIVGGIAVLIQIVGLYLWVSVLGFTAQYLWGVVISYVIALLAAFTLQKYWTFGNYSREGMGEQIGWYTAISLLNLGLNALILHVSKLAFESQGFDFFTAWYLIVQVFAVGICAVIGFLLNQSVTFRPVR